MASIKSPLMLIPGKNHRWTVGEPFSVETDAAGPITVPKGFDTDLTSIPRFLWWESLPSDYAEAAVPHDWAYRGNLPRAVADQMYYELLVECGMGKTRAKARYYALRTFGGRNYAKA